MEYDFFNMDDRFPSSREIMIKNILIFERYKQDELERKRNAIFLFGLSENHIKKPLYKLLVDSTVKILYDYPYNENTHNELLIVEIRYTTSDDPTIEIGKEYAIKLSNYSKTHNFEFLTYMTHGKGVIPNEYDSTTKKKIKTLLIVLKSNKK